MAQSGMASMLGSMLGIDMAEMEELAHDMATTFKGMNATMARMSAQLDRIENRLTALEARNGNPQLPSVHSYKPVQFGPDGTIFDPLQRD